MLEVLSKNPIIQDYVVLYPKIQWRRVIESTLVYGIQTLSDKHPGFLPVEELEQVASGKKTKTDFKTELIGMKKHLNQMKESLGDITGKKSKGIPRTVSATELKKKVPGNGKTTPTSRKKKGIKNQHKALQIVQKTLDRVQKMKTQVIKASPTRRSPQSPKASSRPQTARATPLAKQRPRLPIPQKRQKSGNPALYDSNDELRFSYSCTPENKQKTKFLQEDYSRKNFPYTSSYDPHDQRLHKRNYSPSSSCGYTMPQTARASRNACYDEMDLYQQTSEASTPSP